MILHKSVTLIGQVKNADTYLLLPATLELQELPFAVDGRRAIRGGGRQEERWRYGKQDVQKFDQKKTLRFSVCFC